LLGLFGPEDGAVCTSKTSVDFQWTTRHDIPEGSTLQKNYFCLKKIGLKKTEGERVEIIQKEERKNTGGNRGAGDLGRQGQVRRHIC
jgi:hypothetical protein